MGAGAWRTQVGINHVGAYQVSGRPYVTGSVDSANRGGPIEISFPKVARWIQVINKDTTNDLKVGFSSFGIVNTFNFFTVPKADVDANGATGNSGILELKVSSVFLSGSTNVDVLAGLTNIATETLSSSVGTNWSGSAGVG